MKLVIKTKDIELEYQDEYSKMEADVRDRIRDILKTIYESKPIAIHNIPKIGTVDEIFKNK